MIAGRITPAALSSQLKDHISPSANLVFVCDDSDEGVTAFTGMDRELLVMSAAMHMVRRCADRR